MKRTQPDVAGFEDGGQDYKLRIQTASGIWKRQRNGSSLGPPEGIQPCEHVNFSLVRSISHFWPAETVKIINLC